eukprot:CAMPEP_0172178826 /NCGR_PEP_ID=MMETSP1050-20130122/16260_1 /TAXON_ID=233186 /ORGANISM="Cryptomonas curvata, Strain CCAP979/52" /LENGTH=185 /DNA_ID=CAMNT_0012851605 /DNA_START=110 /DNA_END=664 /DNA_ORIENTATION=+
MKGAQLPTRINNLNPLEHVGTLGTAGKSIVSLVTDRDDPWLFGWCTASYLAVVRFEDKGRGSQVFSHVVEYTLTPELKRTISHIALDCGMMVVAGRSSASRKRKVNSAGLLSNLRPATFILTCTIPPPPVPARRKGDAPRAAMPASSAASALCEVELPLLLAECVSVTGLHITAAAAAAAVDIQS